MPVLMVIILGAAAGFLATRLMRLELGIIETLAIGIGGVVISGLILRTLIWVGGALAGLIGATLGALALIWIYKTYFKR